jgi:molecular chaperone GrpE
LPSSSDSSPGPTADAGFAVTIGDDLIAEALAAVERRAEESRASRTADADEDDNAVEADADGDVTFEFDFEDASTTELEGETIDLGELSELLDEDANHKADPDELDAHEALEAAQSALEDAELAVHDAQAERDEARAARVKARRTAKKYKVALEREVEQRQRLGSTQKLLRDRLSRLEDRLEESESERATVVESLQTVTADLDRNQRDLDRLKAREAQAKAASHRKALERACKELLPVLDNLELAILHADTNPEQVVSGVQMVAQQFVRALSKVGLERVPAVPGTPFNPALHEAMQTVETSAHPPNSIHSEVQAGFTLDDHLLRAARVTVTGAISEAEPIPAADTPPAAAPPDEAFSSPELDSSPPMQSVPEVESQVDPT